ncbi:MarR family winged helix-turn-helix transcriptional regulator [Longimicrobium sp.]|uniref:MarR family winged helix-turn-helix transcriptional regulator n=1 Tax=Longimicrobium sp. TaxID=2029185 RepID=UPI003B3AE18E
MIADNDPHASPPKDDDTAAALKLWVVLNRAHRAIGERARRQIERMGLRPTEFGVLEALYHKGPLTLGQVGERVLVTSGSVTPVVDKLERRGLVQRRISSEDRRVCYAELTDAGRELVGGIFPAHAEEIRGTMEGLTTEEKRIATSFLRRLGYHAAGQG